MTFYDMIKIISENPNKTFVCIEPEDDLSEKHIIYKHMIDRKSEVLIQSKDIFSKYWIDATDKSREEILNEAKHLREEHNNES